MSATGACRRLPRAFQRALGQSSRRLLNATVARASCKLTGVGSSVPPSVLSNDDLAQIVDTNDEWISARTGIKRRHVLSKGENLMDYAVDSAKKALEMSGIAGNEVDMVLLATSSPDDIFGSATQIQKALGAQYAIGFDITAACSGFVVALITAAQFIRTGARKKVVVVGADALSRYIDWNDRGTCILFGDGAGAAVLTAHDGPDALLGMDMNSDGDGYCYLTAEAQPDSAGKAHDAEKRSMCASFANIHMDGQDVFKFAVRAVPKTLAVSLADAGLQGSQIDWLVMHQANKRILDAAAKKLALPDERVVSNLNEYGNTSAASIPIALDEAVRSGNIKSGDTLALAGFGAGLTWASAIVRWQ